MSFGRAAAAVGVVGALVLTSGAACTVNDVTPTPPSEAGLDGTTEAGEAGGGDAAADAIAVATWCSGRPEKFCWDFDRGAYDDGWTRSEKWGSLTSSTDAKSPARSLLMTMQPGSAPLDATLSRSFKATPTTTRLGADFKLLGSGLDAGADSGADAGASAFIPILRFGVSPTCIAVVSFDRSITRLVTTCAGGPYSLGGAPPVDTWVHAELTVTWAADGTGALAVSTDWTTNFALASIKTLDGNPTNDPQIFLGSFVSAGTLSATTKALWDNVTFDY